MNISVDKKKIKKTWQDPFSVIPTPLQGFVKWLKWFFSLSQDERINAGIDAGSDARNR